MVSVCCLTYNQEKFIGQCLDGLVSQKCGFEYEVFVHDDASTDGTAQIVREYAEKYPDRIIPILQKENQYSQLIPIGPIHVFPRAKGKYIAFCEGDDFWTDPYKLEKQVRAMEEHPECRMCLHKVRGVRTDGSPLEIAYPNFSLESGVLSGEKLLDYICTNEYVFQTTSFFMRREDIIGYWSASPVFNAVAATEDTPYLLYFSTLGNIYYIDEEMSCYRHTGMENNARRATYINTEEKTVAHYDKQIRMMEEFDKYTDGKYHALCQRKIDGYHFDRAVRNRDHKELCKRKYRFFKRNWTFKEKVYVYIAAYLPWVLQTR